VVFSELRIYIIFYDGATTATAAAAAAAAPATATAPAAAISDARTDARTDTWETFLAFATRDISWSSPGLLSTGGEASTSVSRPKITTDLTLYTVPIWT
jgi:hypothetical protein